MFPLRPSGIAVNGNDAPRLREQVALRRTTTVVLDKSSPRTYDRFGERELVEAARTDANAFAVLYRRYVKRIHAYAYRRSSSTTIAEDVTAATFEKALRGLGNYRWREPGIGPWLFRIASNELVDVYRADGRQTRTVQSMQAEMLSGAADAAGFAAADTHDDLLGALGEIRPRYQRALTLRYFADLSPEEAAAAMGVSRATMAVVVHRAGAALRRVLEADHQRVVRHG